ncbi:MAG TPA: hypothetical protein VEX86_16915, partial [Longimicrobium sp.]|nr:hypothetical protein [Longimicrobium sp.]
MKQKMTFAAVCILAACAPQPAGSGAPAAPAPSSAAPSPGVPSAAASENQRLDQLAEALFERSMALNPVTATFIGDARYN